MKRKHRLILFGLVTIIISALCVITFTSGKAKVNDRSPKEKQNPIQVQEPIQTDVQARKEPQKNQFTQPKDTTRKKSIVVSDEFDDDLSDLVLKHPPPKQWEAVLADTEATIVELPPLADPPLIEYKPASDKIYKYVTGSIIEKRGTEMRTLSRNSLTFDSDTNNGLIITNTGELNWIMAGDRLMPFIAPNQERIAVLRDDKLISASKLGERLVIGNSPLVAIEAQILKFNLPKNVKLSVGTTWESGEEEMSITRHKVDGYALVNGIKTVKIVSTCENWTPMNQIMSKVSQSLKIDVPIGNAIKLTTYVSLDDGMVVRQENEISMNFGNSGCESTITTQLIGIVERQ